VLGRQAKYECLRRALKANRHCACGCGELLVTPGTRFRAGHFTPCGTLGRVSSAPPTVAPSPLDIVWAAGIYEGEGTCTLEGAFQCLRKRSGSYNDCANSLAARSVTMELSGSGYVSGERGRAFLDAIYGYLSPRRQERIDQYRAELNDSGSNSST